MVFTAKRRQRVIPVVEEPKNRSLEFVKLIGTLYYQKGDYRDLVMKQYAYLTETVRRVLQVDLNDRENDLRSFPVISAQTGVDEQEIAQLVDTLRRLADEEEKTVDEKTMRLLIGRMRHIRETIND
jgi:hypothetical protein